jgi:teichoic acid transport system permease protein
MQAGVAGAGRQYSDVVQVFEPHALNLPPLREYVDDLLERRTFIVELATAEVRGQRSSTFLGELWSLVDPVFQATIYLFLFLLIRGGKGGASATDTATAIIASVFFFNYTRMAIAEAGRSILRHRGLVANAVFPRALLPIAEVYKGFLATLPALAVYGLLHILLRAPLTQAILIVPLLLLVQTVMNLGLAFLFSTATVLIQDVSTLLNYVVRILMFATPVVYPVTALTPEVRSVLSWNPLFGLFASYQDIVGGRMPSVGPIVQSAVWAVLFVCAGMWMFLRHERSFALHV